MYCLNCGKKVEDGSLFCDNCGQPVEPEPADQTLIVPELPGMDLPKDASMDRATIIVPELSDADAAVEDSGASTDVSGKNKKIGLIIGLISGAVLLALITVILCLIFLGGDDTEEDSGKRDTKPAATTTTREQDPIVEEEPTAEELREELTAHTLNGLTFYFPESLEEVSRMDTVVYFDAPQLSSRLQAWVFSGPVEELGMTARTSQQMAEWLMDQEPDEGYTSSEIGERHGVSYVIQRGENLFCVMGCYVKDGYYWLVQIDAYPEQDVCIDYVTLGLVDPSFDPSQLEEEVADADVSLNGLHLMLDTSFEQMESNPESVSYGNEDMIIYISQQTLMDFPEVNSSESFAQWYIEQQADQGWQDLSIEQQDGFYYVQLTSGEGWTVLVGLYVHGNCCWLVTGETEDLAAYGDALAGFMSSGWVVPDEVPEVEMPDQTVEFADMKLDLPSNYKEIYRDTSYVFLSGDMEVYIFTGSVATLDGTFNSAEEMARSDQESYKDYWDYVDLYQVRGITCLMLWDDTQTDSSCVAYGYYMVGGRWWTVEVKSNTLDTETMIGIASSGVLDVEDVEPERELASRDRIDLTGQLTADYYGLQISYSPDWTVDTTWGPSGDYTGNDIEMYTYSFIMADRKVTNAIEFAWQLADSWEYVWDNCEVGLADGTPYILLTDTDSDNFLVIGTYDDGFNCWEIEVYGFNMDLLEEALWYATAGQVTGGTRAT